MGWLSRAQPSVERKKFTVVVSSQELRGYRHTADEDRDMCALVIVKWKGPSNTVLPNRLRKSEKRNWTEARSLKSQSSIQWQEPFEHEVLLTVTRRGQDIVIDPWDVEFVICKAPGAGPEKMTEVARVSVDIATLAMRIESAQDDVATFSESFTLASIEGQPAGDAVDFKVDIKLAGAVEEARQQEERGNDLVQALHRSMSLNEAVQSSEAGGVGVEVAEAAAMPAAAAPTVAVAAAGPVLAVEQQEGGHSDGETGGEGKARSPGVALAERSNRTGWFAARVAKKGADKGDRGDKDGAAAPAKEEEKEPRAAGKDGAAEAAAAADEKPLALVVKAGGWFGGRAGRQPDGKDGSVGGATAAAKSPRSTLEAAGEASLPTSASTSGAEEGTDLEEDACDELRYGSIAGLNLGVLPEMLPTRSKSMNDAPLSSSDRATLLANLGSLIRVGPIGRPTPLEVLDGEGPGGSGAAAQQWWRKRKLSIWATSPRGGGGEYDRDNEEPLLPKKATGEGGEEDEDLPWQADVARDEKSKLPKLNGSWEEYSSLFGDVFVVGQWEGREVTSRDGALVIRTNLFFASLDQRHESAAGAGACTSLVAVIARWLHEHPGATPSQAEYDALIREGSAEWRRLCSVEEHRRRFPDGHFDLETVIGASGGRLQVSAERSYIGFFRPEGPLCGGGASGGGGGGGALAFLEGSMSFEDIWEQVERAGPAVYIVSWNDHFFVLVVEARRCFIIDTLGERLYEGCTRAYILQFSSATTVETVVPPPQLPPPPPLPTLPEAPATAPSAAVASPSQGHGKGKADPQQQSAHAAEGGSKPPPAPSGGSAAAQAEAAGPPAAPALPKSHSALALCGQFVQHFFAAVPLRQLEKDMEKGLVGNEPIHQRLQIEFHYTQLGAPLRSPASPYSQPHASFFAATH